MTQYFLNPDTVTNAEPIGTLEDSATPSVGTGQKTWVTGGTTTITDFTGGKEGWEITIIAEHSVRITNGTNIFLISDHWDMEATDSLTLIQKAGGYWYEKSRADRT